MRPLGCNSRDGHSLVNRMLLLSSGAREDEEEGEASALFSFSETVMADTKTQNGLSAVAYGYPTS